MQFNIFLTMLSVSVISELFCLHKFHYPHFHTPHFRFSWVSHQRWLRNPQQQILGVKCKWRDGKHLLFTGLDWMVLWTKKHLLTSLRWGWNTFLLLKNREAKNINSIFSNQSRLSGLPETCIVISCMEQLYVYFSCVREGCDAVLLWSSKNVCGLWIFTQVSIGMGLSR